MKFSTRKDIEAPLPAVFAAISDFRHYQTQALRRGVKLTRTDTLERGGEGLAWTMTVDLRGKPRDLHSVVTNYVRDEGYEVRTEAGGVTAFTTVDLIALARHRTRVQVGLDLRPDTLKGRIFIQSLKFAKARLDDRFRARVGDFAADVQARAVV